MRLSKREAKDLFHRIIDVNRPYVDVIQIHRANIFSFADDCVMFG